MAVFVPSVVELPTNPNGITYAADASQVLAGRPWADVQRMAARAIRSFHEGSGMDIAAYFSWLTGLGEGEERKSQVRLVFVIDGPASASQLAGLTDVLSKSAVDWSGPLIERVPPNMVRSLLMREGTLYQLWTRMGEDMYHYRLALHGLGAVRVSRTSPDRARADWFLPDIVHAEAEVVAPLNVELERMRLAFAQHYAQQVIEADGRIDSGEKAFMDATFPPDLLAVMRLTETSRREQCFLDALRELPSLLGHHDKLALIGLLFSASYSDGSVDTREMRVLKDAGDKLGLDKEDVVSYLRALL